MAETVTTFIAQSLYNTTSLVVYAVVAGGNVNPALNVTGVAATTWTRAYTAPTGATGATHDVPKELLATVRAALVAASDSGWIVRMRSDGRVEITNTRGAWSLVWDGTASTTTALAYALGYTGNVATTAAGTYAVASYAPAGVVTSMARLGDKGWQRRQAFVAADEMPDGSVVVFASGYVVSERMFDLGFMPRDPAAMAALGSTLTPLEPQGNALYSLSNRIRFPLSGHSPYTAPPWSIRDLVHTALGVELGCILGDFADHVAGTTLLYDACYLDAKTLAGVEQEPIDPRYSLRRHAKKIGLRWYAQETRA